MSVEQDSARLAGVTQRVFTSGLLGSIVCSINELQCSYSTQQAAVIASGVLTSSCEGSRRTHTGVKCNANTECLCMT